MSKTALTNKVALASSGDKLKHWTQAIRDLYAELLELKSGVVPEYHASPTKQYGAGDTFRYGHLRLLDKLLYQFKQNEDGTWWTRSNMPEIQGYKWNAVTWHNGLFVAVGSHGRIVTSRDGKNWDDIHWVDDISYASNFEFYDVKWCGDMFVAVGSYNSFVYSYDGTYWHVPMYVGSIFNSSGVQINANLENLTIRPTGFRPEDAWKGIAYDRKTGIILLCGTQCKTIACRHVPTETVSTILFGNTEFHIDSAEKDTHVLNSIASKELPDEGVTCFVACGNWNEILQCSIRWNTTDLRNIQWGREDRAPVTIEDNVHSISAGTINETTGWNYVCVQSGPDKKDYFVALGTNGQSVISESGIGDTWNVPVYEDSSVTTDFQCQAKGWNLIVAAGTWKDADNPNVTMYNDSVYIETENIEYGSSVNEIQHFTTIAAPGSWFGAAYGNGVFVLAGTENRLYWHEIEEEDNTGAALSVEFYKQYIAELETRLRELESKMLVTDLSFEEIADDTRTFMWTDPAAKMYLTSGNVTLNFISAPQYIYKETMIYLEAKRDTTLTLAGAGEWENDLQEPEWGMEGSHLALKAIFIGSRVILQIIDNDQLADNLIDLLAEEQSQP